MNDPFVRSYGDGVIFGDERDLVMRTLTHHPPATLLAPISCAVQ
jgi:hypothetical protein